MILGLILAALLALASTATALGQLDLNHCTPSPDDGSFVCQLPPGNNGLLSLPPDLSTDILLLGSTDSNSTSVLSLQGAPVAAGGPK